MCTCTCLLSSSPSCYLPGCVTRNEVALPTDMPAQDGYNHAADEFYSASLKRTGLLTELRHEGVDVNVSGFPRCPSPCSIATTDCMPYRYMPQLSGLSD